MKFHQFVTTGSYEKNLVYRMLFADGEEREVPLPQHSLFSIRINPWSPSKEELDEQLRLLGLLGSTRRRSKPLTIMPCIIPERPRVHIRMKVRLCRITETPLLGLHGNDLHLGQKPKLGGRYTDMSLFYTSYFV